MTNDNGVPTPSEKFMELVEEHIYYGVTPLEVWDTWDLLELRDAVSAELQERDREAQEEYYEALRAATTADSYGGTE